MATKFLDLDGLKYFKTKQDAANDGKYVPHPGHHHQRRRTQ